MRVAIQTDHISFIIDKEKNDERKKEMNNFTTFNFSQYYFSHRCIERQNMYVSIKYTCNFSFNKIISLVLRKLILLVVSTLKRQDHRKINILSVILYAYVRARVCVCACVRVCVCACERVCVCFMITF